MVKRVKKWAKTRAKLAKLGEKGVEHVQENLVKRVKHVEDVKLLILEWCLLVALVILLAIVQAVWYVESYQMTAYTTGGTFIEATLGKVNSLNPLYASTSSEQTLAKLMFASLVTVDYSGNLGMDLAESVEADEAGDEWVVKLKEDARWSDGEPITNADVLYTVKVIQVLSTTSYSTYLSGVEVMENEAGELVFQLKSGYANFLSALIFPILPAHILGEVEPAQLLEHSFSAAPTVASGPFVYNATQLIGTEGEKMVYLVRNENYYKTEAKLDSLIVHAFLDVEGIIAEVNAGTVTGTAEITAAQTSEITNASYLIKETSLNSGVYLFFNTTGEVFNDKTLRQAVQQGIDMRSLRAPLGEELALDYPLLNSQVALEEADWPELPEYDPETAKSKVSGQTVRLVTAETGYLPALAENLVYQLEQLGFEVETEIYQAGQDFLVNVVRERNYDLLLYEIDLGVDADVFAYYHSSQATSAGLNLSNWSNTLASDALLAARSTTNRTLQALKLKSFLEYWVEEVPAIGVYQTNLIYVVKKNTQVFSEDARLTMATDRLAEVENWAVNTETKNRTP